MKDRRTPGGAASAIIRRADAGPLVDRRTALAGVAATAAVGSLSGCAAAAPVRTLFGVNCYDLFNDLFNDLYGRAGAVRDPAVRLQEMAKLEIPFVRFAASPYWPPAWKKYEENRSAAIRRMDGLVAAAERLGVRLVPTVIWNPSGVSDHFNEPASAWGDPNSHTRQFARDYSGELIRRYGGSKAILAWEASNEFNAFADQPLSEKFWPRINVAEGTPAKRTHADRISSADVANVYEEFVNLVHKDSPGTPVSTGANIPRINQINNLRQSWDPDNETQFMQALQLALAGKAGWLSLHLYNHSVKGRFGWEGVPYLEVLMAARRVATDNGARLFVGEFGVQRSGDRKADEREFGQQIDAIRSVQADYAALWCYDIAFMPEWSVTAGNSRAWQLDVLRKINAIGFAS